MTKLNLTPYFIIAILALIIFSGIAVQRCSSNKQDAIRQESNLQTKNDSVQILTLTIREYKNTEFKNKSKIDSLMKSNNTKPRLLERATITSTSFKDTTKVNATIGTPVIVQNRDTSVQNRDTSKINPKVQPLYFLPVSSSTNCWGIKGRILTRDTLSQFQVTERTFNTVQSILITRQKRFIGFLWITRHRKVLAQTDCGKIEITDVIFTK